MFHAGYVANVNTLSLILLYEMVNVAPHLRLTNINLGIKG